MLKLIRSSYIALSVGMISTVGSVAPVQAQSYQIDCAILLCLSGGWPASVPCARARAEFIRRITPWPIEPPLQIWRCPMGISFQDDRGEPTSLRLFDIAMADSAVLHSFPVDSFLENDTPVQPAVQRFSGGEAERIPEDAMLHLIQQLSSNNRTADIDISGAEFNFVRSIRVFEVRAYQRESGSMEDRDCNRSSSVRLGSYGEQGGFGWSRSDLSVLPIDHIGTERWGSNCPTVWHRSVFVDWRDYEGNYGFEQVNY